MRMYVDLDGVFNACRNPHTPQEPQPEATGWYGTWKNAHIPSSAFETLPPYWGEKFYLCWSEELIEKMNSLADNEDIEIVWATTWRHLATELFAPIAGLKSHHWRVLHAPVSRIKSKEIWWKHELIEQDLKENPVEKFVWVDDELPKNRLALEWAQEIEGAKVITPSLHTGITKNEWHEITNHLLMAA